MNDITASFQNQIPVGASATYFETETDAFNNVNPLGTPYRNTLQDSQTIFVKVTSNDQCYAISTVDLNVLYTPTLLDDETVFYCLNSFPETVRIFEVCSTMFQTTIITSGHSMETQSQTMLLL
ncbi:MAG: hypothetical protein R2783_06315 [Gelidibacter sp.]